MKLKRRDYLNIGIISILFLIIILIITRFKFINGSTTDFESQHYIIPEYFRNLFYSTGSIVPNFAFHLGGGQNIWNLSYYGLLSPIILISYLLPFIKMLDYVMFSMIIITIIDIFLMYKWINNKYGSKYAFISTCLFTFSMPIVYHTHRHIMFVNYMPFLILALMGVDKYFENGKKALLIGSTFLIIMTSYFFSIPSILVIIIYGIYQYLETKRDEKVDVRNFLKDGMKFVLPILLAVLMASVFLLPTLHSLLAGRDSTSSIISMSELFIPRINYKFMLYESYGVGTLSIIYLVIIEHFFRKEKKSIFIGIVLSMIMLFPIFVYVLNAGMYISGKVLIPFVPVIVLFMVQSIKNLLENKYDDDKEMIMVIYSLLLVFIQIVMLYGGNNLYYIYEPIVIFLALILYIIFKKKYIIIGPIIVCSFLLSLHVNLSDKLILKKEISEQDKMSTIVSDIDNSDVYRTSNNIYELRNINKIYNMDYYTPAIYSSISNKYLNNLYLSYFGNNIPYYTKFMDSPTSNILYHFLMSDRYLISEHGLMGYEKIGNNLYENKDVLPIFYASNKIISKELYDNMKEYEKSYALLSNIIIDKEIPVGYEAKMNEIKLDYEVISKSLNYEYDGTTLKAVSDRAWNEVVLKLNEEIKDKILFISFDIYGDNAKNIWIDINDVRNLLSYQDWKYHNLNYNFSYSISSNEIIDELRIKFSEGLFVLDNFKVYALDYSDLAGIKDTLDEFTIDNELTKGDKIVGNINVTNDGSYFKLGIPYDDGFTIKVDGKKVSYELVNDAFMGFEIDKGSHKIEIIYNAPWLNIGKAFSLVGVIIFGYVVYLEKKKGKQK